MKELKGKVDIQRVLVVKRDAVLSIINYKINFITTGGGAKQSQSAPLGYFNADDIIERKNCCAQNREESAVPNDDRKDGQTLAGAFLFRCA